MNILFICSMNSEIGQTATAIARDIFGDDARIESAYEPTIDHLSTHFLDNLDYLISLGELDVNTVLTSPDTKKLTWSSQELQDQDQIKAKIENFADEVRPLIPRESVPDVTTSEAAIT